MTKYLFNEGVVWEDRRKRSYIVPYIILFIILALIAVVIWLTAPLLALMSAIIPFLPLWLVSPVLLTKILISVVFGVLALLVLIMGIMKLNRPRLFLTPRRLCLISGPRSYKEARFDKIDGIIIKGHKIIIFAGGKKVISFGPVNDPYATRNAIVGLIAFEIKPPEDESIVFDKAVPLHVEEKEADVFDADVVS